MKNFVITERLLTKLIDYLEDKPAKEVIQVLNALYSSPTVEDFIKPKQENQEEKKDG